MTEERQDQKTGPEAEEVAATTAGELEDLAPSQDESEVVKGGTSIGGGWNRVKNIQG